MNYSKDSRAQEEQTNNPKQKRKKKKGKVVAFRVFLMALIIVVFALVGGTLGVVIGIIKNTPDASTIVIKPTGQYMSFVYDANDNVIDTFSTADNRIYAQLSEIPNYLQKAVIALEDERFYEHNGIDIKGIFRAILANIKSGSFSEGASTITQQLVKNNVLTSEKKITRKIQEQYLAIQIEKLYSKDTILEYYLNTIALGQGVSGVQSAAHRYFNKDVSDLTLTECAVIAVITQYPTRYNPISNPENNWEKVKVTLNKMEEQGYITPEEHQAALQENPYDNIQEVHKEFTEKSTRTYFVDAVLEEVIDDLQERLGYTETQANNEVYGGGLKIKTTFDPHMQAIVDKYMNDDSLYPSSLYELNLDYTVAILDKEDKTKVINKNATGVVKSKDDVAQWRANQLAAWGIQEDEIQKEVMLEQPQPQASFVLSDYRTGQVKALYGGRGDKTNRGFNYATQAERQPGSTFKVLAAYAPALNEGLLSPGSTIMDEPYTIKQSNGRTYSPSNWDNVYVGPTTVRRAIYHSMNVVAVKTAYEIVGINTAFDYLLNFGFTTLVDADRVPALPLGGITNGVTALELNAAYSAIANDGMYVKPVFYTQVLDSNNRIILDNTGEALTQNSHVVIKSSVADLLTDMMQDVITHSDGTGGTIRKYFTSQPVAGKTGTTSDSKDLVFAGYTPYYAATIWTGYTTPKTINASSYHLALWGRIMNEIHEGLPYKSFPKVEKEVVDIQSTNICTVSGKLATALCEASGENCVKSEYFSSGNMPSESCDIHTEVSICNDSGKLATEYCPTESITTKVIRTDSENADVPTEYCDIHTAPTTGEEVVDPGLAPEVPGVNGDGTALPEPLPEENMPVPPEGAPTVPEAPPAAPPNVPSEPSVPSEPAAPAPITPPENNPNPDDEDSFFIPQE